MDALELAIRFSYQPNMLHYCGRPEANETFNQYLKKKDNGEEVRKQLSLFEGLPVYLKTIGEVNNKDWLDKEVIEAYWIGNNLLNNMSKEHIERIIQRLQKRGLPSSIVQNRLEKLPEGLVPTHDFHVFYMGVGMTSGNVKPTLHSMENCRINTGRVIEVRGESLIVNTTRTELEGEKLVLVDDTRTITYLPELITPKPGDTIAIHWGFAPIILDEEQKKQLENYTNKVRAVINETPGWLLRI